MPPAMNEETLDLTNRPLRVIIALLVRRKKEDEQTLTLKQQIEMLKSISALDLGRNGADTRKDEHAY